MCIVLVLCVIINYSITKKTSIENEVYDSLEQAIDQSLEMINTKPYEYKSDEELVSEFCKAVELNINSDSKISIKVYRVDYKEGYLDVELSEEFVHGNGKKAVVKCRKSGICEKYHKI